MYCKERRNLITEACRTEEKLVFADQIRNWSPPNTTQTLLGYRNFRNRHRTMTEIRCQRMERERLPQALRWKIADWLTEDRLAIVNSMQDKVVFKETFYTKYGKRALDIVFSLIALIITLPINLLIGIVTFFDVGRPIFFSQTRTGKNGKEFCIVKFRNMRNVYDERGELLPAKDRVTKWGKFVRETSLDELLNFWSVLKGDMSLIGPRPLVPQYMSRYSDRHKARFLVRPGLECPPRNGHGSLRTWTDQFENDVWYVENICFKTDILQAFNLVRYALDRKNAAARASSTRGAFMGYDFDGNVINLQQVPETYIARAMELLKIDVEESKI